MKKLFLLLVFIFITSFAFSQIIVEYVEGQVDLQQQDSWVEIFIGDELLSSDTIKLMGASCLELRANENRLIITSPGVYQLENLVGSSSERRNIVSSLTNKIRLLTNESDQRSQTSVAGVRASEAVTAPQVQWAEESSSSLMDDGIFEFENGYYEDALDLFEEALYFAEQDEDTDAIQYANLLIGISNIEIGEIEIAEEYFLAVVEINPENEQSEIAKEFLENYYGN